MSTLNVFVSNADNQLVIFLNGQEVYNRTTEHDQQLNEDVNLSRQLRSGFNVLQLVGANWSEGAHFKARVVFEGQDIAEYDQRLAGRGIVWSAHHELEVN